MIDNRYAPAGYFWWFGVVEDRMDPLFLGRCRVRIVGYHTPDKAELPTEDLPWAMPIQPITSGAMSGIGSAPLGVVEGTWVTGFFRDGESCQEPVITGTIGGIPQPDTPVLVGQSTYDQSTIQTPNKEDYVSSAPEIVSRETIDGVVGPLTNEDLDTLFGVLRQRESSNNYSVVNRLGFMGAYQFGAAILEDLGYIKSGCKKRWEDYPKNDEGLRDDFAALCVEGESIPASTYSRIPDKSKTYFNFYVLSNDSLWATKSGGSGKAFLGTPATQDRCIRDAFTRNYRGLVGAGVIGGAEKKDKAVVAGYLFAAHLLGVGGASKLKGGTDKADDNGTKGSEYYALGYRTLSAKTVKRPPKTLPKPKKNDALIKRSGNHNTETTLGFVDPNKIYPKKDHIGEPDTNRLARHQKLADTIVSEKDSSRLRGVENALGEGIWDQPQVPYNAKYPFNKVYESESGHTIEIDDTPGNERLHIYHRNGTFIEIDRNGCMVKRVTGDEYSILERNGYISIAGRANITVEGTCNIFVKNDCNLEVNGGLTQHVHGDYELNVAGKIRVVAGTSVDIKSGTNTNIEAGKNLNLSGSNSVKLSGLKVSAKALTTLGLEGGVAVNLKSLSFKVGAPSFKVVTPPKPGFVSIMSGSGATGANTNRVVDRLSPKESVFPSLYLPSRAEEVAAAISALSENPKENKNEIAAAKAKAIAEGIIDAEEFTKEPIVEGADETAPPEKNIPVKETCTGIFDGVALTETFFLSANYTVGDLTNKTALMNASHALRAQHGLTKEDIACNLKAIAENILEPMLAKYPNMIVSSGFRAPGHSKARGISLHEKGQAVDLQFPGTPNKEYYGIAQWVRDNIVFDQLLLEYKSTGTGLPWIHLTYKKEGRRNIISTLFNHNTAPNGRGVLLQLA